MLAKGQITVTNLDDGKTPFLHQAYKMKDGRFLKHYPVYEAPPVNGYKEGDLWHRTDGLSPGYFVANKSNTTLNSNDWTFYADELAYSDTDKFYPKFEGTYSDYNEVASDDQTKYTWKIIQADDGIGIKSVKEYYAVSTSNVTPPSLQSDWSETPKATNTTNKYLWNYEVYTYSNGDVKETTKRVIGTHGATGATGVSSYTWIRYSPNADGSSMTPTPAANSLYIGVATTSANSAPPNYTSYTWALIKGADGKGVKSAAITYQAGTSGTVIPTGSWGSTIPTVPKGQYLWTRVITTYTDNSTSTSYSASYQGVDGVTNVTGLLTNESITLPANVGGTVTTYTGATGTFEVFEGLTKKTGPSVAYSVLSKTNIEVAIATTGVYTITSMTSGTTVLNGFATLRAIYNGVTIDKQISVTKAVTGATGATGSTGATGAQGASATSYWITASNNIIGKSQTGVINPTTITFKGFSKTGTANSVAYSGRFIIQTSTNGTSYTTRYTSSADQNSYTYTIPADSLFVKCLFYMAGGTTVLLDEQTVPIVESAEGIQVGGRNRALEPVEIGCNLGSGVSSSSAYRSFTTAVLPIGEYIISHKTDMGVRLEPSANVMFLDGSGVYNFTKPLRIKVTTESSFNVSMRNSDTSDLGDEYLTLEEMGLKLEKGTVATDWSPAPEDARTYKAWANSSDGTVDFTRVYPNENLLLESNQSVTTSTYEVKNYPLADDTLTATDDVVITLKGALGADRTMFNAYNSGGSSHHFTLIDIGNGIHQYKGKWSVVGTNSFLRIYQFNSLGTSSSTIEWIKLERGTTPTIYTTNTADSLTGSVMQYVGFSPLDSDKPSDYEWIINPEWTESSSREYTSSKIEQTSESIMTTVTESFVAEEDYTKYREDVATQFQQTATDFNLLFSTVSEEVKKVESGSEVKFEKIEKYVRFVDGKIILGTSDSDSVLEISNDRISFIQGGNEVAHFAGQTFTISKGILTESMQVGDHKMTKNTGGLTTFDYMP